MAIAELPDHNSFVPGCSKLLAEIAMSKKKPLKPEDFAVHSNQGEIVTDTDTDKPVSR